MRLFLLLALLASFAAPSAHAQRDPVSRIGTIERENNRRIDEALEYHRIDPDRLSRYEQDALGDAFEDLYPDKRYSTYRLSDTQADAIVYVALVRDDQGRPRPTPYPDPRPYPVPLPVPCDELIEAAFALSAAVPANDYSLFLTNAEKDRVREGAAEIRTLASRCGCLAVAERALVLPSLVAPLNADRDDVVQALAALRREASACRR